MKTKSLIMLILIFSSTLAFADIFQINKENIPYLFGTVPDFTIGESQYEIDPNYIVSLDEKAFNLRAIEFETGNKVILKLSTKMLPYRFNEVIKFALRNTHSCSVNIDFEYGAKSVDAKKFFMRGQIKCTIPAEALHLEKSLLKINIKKEHDSSVISF